MPDERPAVTRLSTVLRELHAASEELLRTVDDPRPVAREDGHSVIHEQYYRLRQAVAAAESQMKRGVIYGLYDATSGAIRYIGQTTEPLAVRERAHSRANTLVGDRYITERWLQIAPLEAPHLFNDGERMERVPANRLNRLEQDEIYRYTWAGAALLNRSNARDEARAWQWKLNNGPYPYWGSIQDWREAVRTVPCYECPSLSDEPCVQRYGAALPKGANHLGRIAARVRLQWCADRADQIRTVAEDVIGDHEYAYLFQDAKEGSIGNRLKALYETVASTSDPLEIIEYRSEVFQILMRDLAKVEHSHGVREMRAAEAESYTWRSADLTRSGFGLESLVSDMCCAYAEISGISLGPTKHRDHGFLR
ncbi:hypothetical protein AB0J38_21910 [Streptomyces sp. NPDC050095]|uniref:hypothetical protein n=1 Tax=unclassified Streptomyces TaxID=2593676 RepID=UPI0034189874